MATTENIAFPEAVPFTADSINIATGDTINLTKINKRASLPVLGGGNEIKSTPSSSSSSSDTTPGINDQNKDAKLLHPPQNNNPLKLINSTSQISNDSILNSSPSSSSQNICNASRPPLVAERTNRDNTSKVGKFVKNANFTQINIPSSQNINTTVADFIATGHGEMETLNSISKYNCVAPAPNSASNRIVYKDSSSVRGEKKKGKVLSTVLHSVTVDLDNKNVNNSQSQVDNNAIMPQPNIATAPTTTTLKRGKNQSVASFKKECNGEQASTLLEDEEDPYAWGEFGGVGDLIIDLDANIEKSLSNNKTICTRPTPPTASEKDASTASSPKLESSLMMYRGNGPLVASKSSNLKVKIKRKNAVPPSSAPPPLANASSIKGARGKNVSSVINNATKQEQQSSSSSGYNEIVTSCNGGNTIAVPNGSTKICLHKSMPHPHPPPPTSTIPSLPPTSSSPSPLQPNSSISSSNVVSSSENHRNNNNNIDKLVAGGGGDVINYTDNGKLLSTYTSPWLMNNGPGFKRSKDEQAIIHCPQNKNTIQPPSSSTSHPLALLGQVSNWDGLNASTADPVVIKTNNNNDIIRVNVPKKGIANNDGPLISAKFVKQPDSPTAPSSPLRESTNDVASLNSTRPICENACKTSPILTIPPTTTIMSPGLLATIPPNQSMCLKLPPRPSVDSLDANTLSPQSVKTACPSSDAATVSVECGASKDQSTSVEEHLLGPCDAGTVVSLNGVVWQENTASGMLVLNITWRGLNYVGTLMDTSKVKWAPPKLGAYNHHGSCGSGHKQHHVNNAHHLSASHSPCTPNRASTSNNATQSVVSHDANGTHSTTALSSSSSVTPNTVSNSTTFANNCCSAATGSNLSPSMAAYNMGGRVKRTRAAVAAAAAALASALAEATKTDSSSSSPTNSVTNTTTIANSLLEACEPSKICEGAISQSQHQNQLDHGLERCNFFLPQSNARRSAFSSPRQAINSSPAKREFEGGDENVLGNEGVKRLCPDPQTICSASTPNSPDKLDDAAEVKNDVKCPVAGCYKSYASKIAMEFHLNRSHDQGLSEEEWQTLLRREEPSDEIELKCEVSESPEIKEEIPTEIPENSEIEPNTSPKSEITSAIIVDQQASPILQSIQKAKSPDDVLNIPVSSPKGQAIISTNIPTSLQTPSNPEQASVSQTSTTQSNREVIDPSDPFSVLLTDPRYREQMGLSQKRSKSPSNTLNTTPTLPNKISGRQSYSADYSVSTQSQQQSSAYRHGSARDGAKLTYQLSQDSLVHTLHKSQAISSTPFQDHLRMLQLQSRLEEPDLTPSSFGHRISNLHHPYYFYDAAQGFPTPHPSTSASKLFQNERFKLDRSMSGAPLSHQETFGCERLDKNYGGSASRIDSPSCPSSRPTSQTPPGPYDFVTANEDLVGKIRLVDPLSNGRTATTNRTICANANNPSPHAKFPNTHQGAAAKLNSTAATSLKSKSPHGPNCSNNFTQYLMPPLGCVGSMPSYSLHQQLGAAKANYPSNMTSLPFPPFNNYPSPGPGLAHYFPGYPPMPDPNATYNGSQGPGTLIPPQMMDPYMAAALFANQHDTMAALAASGLPAPFYHVPMAQHRPSPTPTPAQPSSHHYNK